MVDERGFSCRSDAIRELIREYMVTSSSRIDRKKALTPKEVAVKGNHYTMDWDEKYRPKSFDEMVGQFLTYKTRLTY